MATCVTNAELITNNEKPLGNGGPVETRPSWNPLTQISNWRSRIEHENTQRRQWHEAVAQAIDADTLPTGINSREQAQVRSVGKYAAKLVDENFIDRRTQEFQDAMDMYYNANVGQQSAALSFTSWISTRFAEKSTPLFEYFALNAGVKGRHSLDHPGWAAFKKIEPEIQGKMQFFSAPMDALTEKIRPIAERLHTDPVNVMLGIGDWLNADHMPSRNALLLERMRADLHVLLAQPESTQRNRSVSNLSGWIADLEASLDTVRIVGENGRYIDPETNTVSYLRTGGMTNAEAAKLKADVLAQLDISEAEMRGYAQEMRAVVELIHQERIKNGTLDPQVVAEWPGGEYGETYVPIKTKLDNTTGVINNSNIYNPGTYFSMEGTYFTPDSAYKSIIHYAQRASYEIAMKDLGVQIASMHEANTALGRNVGIRREKLAPIYKALNSSNPAKRAWAEQLNNQGGVVVDVPVTDAAGNTTTTRWLYYFDPTWTDPVSGHTGAKLNAALSGTVETAAGIKPLATATSWYGQLLARFNPPLAVANGLMRDPFERMVNMAGRDYYANGRLIRGSSLVGDYLANYPRAMKMVYENLITGAEENSTSRQLWNEYIATGAKQEFLTGRDAPLRTMADALTQASRPSQGSWAARALGKPELREVKRQIDALGTFKNQAISTLDRWNAYFNNLAPFAQFLTLRRAGVNAADAGKATLDLFSLYSQGTWQPMLSTLFPFVKPTVATGVALARTLGLSPNASGKFQPNYRGYLGMLGAYLSYAALYPLAKESMGTDPETGRYRIDGLGSSSLTRFLPFGFGGGGDYFKLHLGFGGPGIAAAAYVGMDRMQRGLMSPQDVVFDVLYAAGKNVTPGNWPEFSMKANPIEWFKHAFAPTLLKPVISNVDFRGRPITQARTDGNRPISDQGYLTTEKAFHQAAKNLYSWTGIDVAPEQVKNVYNSFNIGFMRIAHAVLASTVMDTDRKGSERDVSPWLKAMGVSMFHGREYDTNRSIYYQVMDRMNQQVKSVGADVKAPKGVRLDSPEYAEAMTRTLKSAGFDDTFIHDWLLGKRIESQIRSNSIKFNSEIRPIWLSSDDSAPVKEKFKELAGKDGQLFEEAVRQFRMLEGR